MSPLFRSVLSSSLESKNKELTALARQCTQLRENVSSLSSSTQLEMQSLRETASKLQTEKDQLLHKLTDTEAKLNETVNQLSSSQLSLSHSQEQVQTVTADLAITVRSLELLRDQKAKLEEDQKNHLSSIDSLQVKCSSHEESIINLSQQIQSLQEEKEKLSSRLNVNETVMGELTSQLGASKKEISSLRELLDTQQVRKCFTSFLVSFPLIALNGMNEWGERGEEGFCTRDWRKRREGGETKS